MSWLRMLWVVVRLELAQRVRSVAWYVLLGIVALVVGSVLVVLWLSLQGWNADIGGTIFSTTVFLALLVTSLVTPALSGGSVNGDREAGTLAATQVTQVTSTQLVLGKVLASWLASLGFLGVCLPFLLFGALNGGVRMDAVLASIPVTIVEIGVLSAVGVGLSAMIRKPILSTVVSYLVVAMLTVGTLIAFGVASVATTRIEERQEMTWDWDETTDTSTCRMTDRTYETPVQHTEQVWWLLAANPFVVLADAVPVHIDGPNDYPEDLFEGIAWSVRSAQLPQWEETCESYDAEQWGYTPEEVFEQSTPSWFVGLSLHLGMAALAVWGGIAATRAPARTLAPGSRIA